MMTNCPLFWHFLPIQIHAALHPLRHCIIEMLISPLFTLKNADTSFCHTRLISEKFSFEWARLVSNKFSFEWARRVSNKLSLEWTRLISNKFSFEWVEEPIDTNKTNCWPQTKLPANHQAHSTANVDVAHKLKWCQQAQTQHKTINRKIPLKPWSEIFHGIHQVLQILFWNYTVLWVYVPQAQLLH